MSYDPTYLTLWQPPAADGQQLQPAPCPNGPDRLQDAGRVFSHGLLVGDMLGLDTAAAQQTLDTVYHLPDDLPRLFLEDAIAVLQASYRGIAQALAAALDDDGRPAGQGGARLAASPHIAADAQGRLQVRGTRFSLSLLLARLQELDAMLGDAMSRDLLVVEKPVYPDDDQADSD